jgi:hypothetical protein
VGAGIVIEFEEAATSLIFEVHTDTEFPLTPVGFQFCHRDAGLLLITTAGVGFRIQRIMELSGRQVT